MLSKSVTLHCVSHCNPGRSTSLEPGSAQLGFSPLRSPFNRSSRKKKKTSGTQGRISYDFYKVTEPKDRNRGFLEERGRDGQDSNKCIASSLLSFEVKAIG